MDSAIITLKIELEALKKERDAASVERAAAVRKALEGKQAEADALEKEWRAEKERLEKIKRARYGHVLDSVRCCMVPYLYIICCLFSLLFLSIFALGSLPAVLQTVSVMQWCDRFPSSPFHSVR